MKTDFENLIHQIEAEAVAEGPEAQREFHALQSRFQLARELRAARKEAGVTQQSLAETSGIGQAEISKIENGDINATVSTLTLLGAPLNLDLHFLHREDGQSASSASV